MCEQISYACEEVCIDTIHVAWGSYYGIHISVAILNTLFNLKSTEEKINVENSNVNDTVRVNFKHKNHEKSNPHMHCQ